MSNWRTNLGGAVSTIGKGLIMMGVLPQLAGTHSNVLWWITLTGYVINIIGEAVAKFFAADAKALNDVVQQTNLNTVQIADAKNVIEQQLKP